MAKTSGDSITIVDDFWRDPAGRAPDSDEHAPVRYVTVALTWEGRTEPDPDSEEEGAERLRVYEQTLNDVPADNTALRKFLREYHAGYWQERPAKARRRGDASLAGEKVRLS